MLKMPKVALLSLTLSAVISQPVFANEKADPFDNQASYAVGVLLGTNVQEVITSQKPFINYDKERILSGVNDVLAGKVKLEGNDKLLATLKKIEEKITAAEQAEFEKISAKAKQEGENFRNEFAKKAGVQKTASGLLYLIENAGEGEIIKATDSVKVHYTGKLPDGTVFDSSVARGTPAEFKLNQVVAGWTEGLQLVKKGGKIELVLPPELAYGERGAGSIPPNSTLHFTVEVLDVNAKK